MLAAKGRKQPKALVGSPLPRIAPPTPLRHELKAYRVAAAELDIEPMPWQDTAAKYLTARAPDDKYLYREVAVVVGRQNGKTTLTKPLIVDRLKTGRRVMHIAQVRELPRIMFEAIADALEATPELFPKRRGKIIWPRRGAGSESIVLTNGGSYRIAAAVTGSARGHGFDDLLIDELREMETWDVINAAKPAQRFAIDPQTIYLSNMGTESSVVLNSLRTRAGQGPEGYDPELVDPSLAYLEWSADPTYGADDHRGWIQADPAIGHYPQVLRDLEKDYVAAVLGGNLAGFEAEALCRRVPSMARPLLPEGLFESQEFLDNPGTPRTAYMAIKMFDDRVSAAVAWSDDVGRVTLDIHDARATDAQRAAVGADLKKIETASRSRLVAFDPYTDADLTRYLRHPKAMLTRDYAAASEKFINLATERKLRIHDPAGVLGPDLARTVRKGIQSGAFIAARSGEDPNTAAEAAIRAAWLASAPRAPFIPQVVY